MRETFAFSETHQRWMQRDSEFVLGWRYFPKVIFQGGQGVMLKDVDGNEYYDLTSGMMSLPLGHRHPELTEVLQRQAEQFVHQSSWYSNPWIIEFAELLASTLPAGLKKVNFAVTGSEANEVAMRVAVGATGKFDFVSVMRGLYGGSLAVESLTSVGGMRKQNLGPLLMPSRANAILPPFCYRCPINLEYPSCQIACIDTSDEFINYVSTHEVAAIFAETMPVSGGMIVPPPEWLPRLKRLAEKWGALLVLDEIQLAPAKTGRLWAFEHYGVVPDIVTFGKGMSAGMPITGMVTTSEIAEWSLGKAGMPWAGTYTGDPLGAAVALRQLQIILRDNYTARAEKLGAFLKPKLDRLKDAYDVVGDVRGKGLYLMLDIVQDKLHKVPDPAMAERIRYNALLGGLVLIAVKNFIRICPPLIITERQLEDVAGRLELAIKKAMEGHPRDVDFAHASSLAR